MCVQILWAGQYRKETVHQTHPVVHPPPTDVAAGTGGNQEGHRSSIIVAVAGFTVQASEGSSNESLSPSGLGVETWPASDSPPGGEAAPPEVRHQAETKGMKGK